MGPPPLRQGLWASGTTLGRGQSKAGPLLSWQSEARSPGDCPLGDSHGLRPLLTRRTMSPAQIGGCARGQGRWEFTARIIHEPTWKRHGQQLGDSRAWSARHIDARL